MSDTNQRVEVRDIALIYAFLVGREALADDEKPSGDLTYKDGRVILVMTPEERVKFAELCEDGQVAIALNAARSLKSHLSLARQMQAWQKVE